MKGSGPKQERETVIRICEGEDKASAWTASDTVYRRLLKRLGTDYLTEDGERHAIFEFPSKWLNLPRKRESRRLDPAQSLRLQTQLAKRR